MAYGLCRSLVVLGRNNPSLYTVNGGPLYVHLNGLGIVLLKYAMKVRSRALSPTPDVKFPRFSNRRTKMLNQSSMWFSQLLCFGVERKRMRWLVSLKNAARVGIDCKIPRFSFSPNSSLMPHTRATSLTKASDLCVLS